MTDQPALLNEAIEHHQAGRVKIAEHLYKRQLALTPEHAVAHHALGVLQVENGRIESGLEHLRCALESDPETGHYWTGYSQGLLAANRPEDARRVLDQAESIGLSPSLTRELREAIEHASRQRTSTTLDQGAARATSLQTAATHTQAPPPLRDPERLLAAAQALLRRPR